MKVNPITVNVLLDVTLSTDGMTDDECKAELAASGVDVDAAGKRMDAAFDRLRTVAREKDAARPAPMLVCGECGLKCTCVAQRGHPWRCAACAALARPHESTLGACLTCGGGR